MLWFNSFLILECEYIIYILWPLLVSLFLQQDHEAWRPVCFPEGSRLQGSSHRTTVWYRAGHVLPRCGRVYHEPVHTKANLWLNRPQYRSYCGSYTTNCTFQEKININQDGRAVERTATSTLVKFLWDFSSLTTHPLWSMAYLIGHGQNFALVGKGYIWRKALKMCLHFLEAYMWKFPLNEGRLVSLMTLILCFSSIRLQFFL